MGNVGQWRSREGGSFLRPATVSTSYVIYSGHSLDSSGHIRRRPLPSLAPYPSGALPGSPTSDLLDAGLYTWLRSASIVHLLLAHLAAAAVSVSTLSRGICQSVNAFAS